MSVVGAVEAAIGTVTGAVTGARWWRLAATLAPFVLVLVLAAALLATRATLARVRLEDAAELARRAEDAAEQKAAWAERSVQAADAYAARAAALKPLVVQSTNTVREYAETPAGRVLCRDADRVRGIDALDASLRAADPAAGGDGALPADPAAPPAGR